METFYPKKPRVSCPSRAENTPTRYKSPKVGFPGLGSRKFTSWRAKSQVGAPSPDLARANWEVGARQLGRCMVHKQRPAAREDVAGGLDHATERCCTFAHRWHTVGRQLARANSGFGARQLVSWRAPSPELLAPSGKLARQLPVWRAPTPLLAHAKSGFGAPTYHLARPKTMPSHCLLISSTACCPDSDSPRSLPPACAWGQAGAKPGACPARPSAP